MALQVLRVLQKRDKIEPLFVLKSEQKSLIEWGERQAVILAAPQNVRRPASAACSLSLLLNSLLTNTTT